MMNKYRLLSAIAVLAFCVSSFAQIAHTGQPYQWANKTISTADIPLITTAALDMTAISQEDQVVDGFKETPYRFGIEHEVGLDLFEDGQMTTLTKGDKLWQLAIKCPKATSINLNFSDWSIPVGGEVTIWSKDRSEFLGVYNHLNNKDYNSFAVGLIHSDQIVVEYYEQAQVTEQAEIRIGTIVHGYRTVVNKWEDLEKGPFGNSGSCNMNVNCPDGGDWQDEKRGVALILNGGNAWCTGSLINNTAQDGASYFLTAAHCDANESNWVFYFNHETASCSGSTGPTNQSISGATQLASGASSDYHLIQLSTAVPASYNPYYNGWDRSNSAVSSAVGIHHPSGDVKKISFDDDPLQKTNYSSNSTTSSGTHWRIETWERNTTTEGGSSGSPLFDQNHRIIGQLHGGGAACGNTASDWYGAFGNSWSGMASILDPTGSGALTLNGMDGGGTAPTCSDGIQNQGETGVDCGGPCAPCPCNGTNVTVSLTFDNYPEETSWSISSGGTTVASGGTYASQADGSTLNIDVCLPEGCYDFTINDAYSDGMCCSYGNGSYTVSSSAGTLASGGSFTNSETTQVCVGGTAPTCNDGIQNQGETGIDCGGPCTACPSCTDGIQNGSETGVDCGGPDCAPCATCNDGIQNQGETGIDCGGPCAACTSCSDGIQNGSETGVDCGGPDCAPCSGCDGTEVTVSITFDQYASETSWSISSGGTTVASGNNYGGQATGSTISVDVCLPDGCYDFTINDSYGDGICCAHGNGSYSLSSSDGTLASGGSFASSETTEICVGTIAPTCSDGIQNGSETGVDCGGPDCAPCGGGGCTTTLINFTNFDSGWSIWNDGGSDCVRSTSAANASSGTRSARLRDNTNSSVTTTDNLNLSAYNDITVDFGFRAVSMENNEDFWLQISTNGGSSYTTVASYASGSDFSNNTFYTSSVDIAGPFTSNTRLRFRCDASSNADYVYIDDVNISGCLNVSMAAPVAGVILEEANKALDVNTSSMELSLFPNPASDLLNLTFETETVAQLGILVVDMQGRTVLTESLISQRGTNKFRLDSSVLGEGTYIMYVSSEAFTGTKRFVVTR